MTIASTDLKLKKPERLTDNADGGGRQTSVVIEDGVLNNVFQDISRLDRVTGRVSLRKGFFHVHTANTDTLLGAHVILIDPPDDDFTFVCIFATGSPIDERLAAQNRVEAYVIQGPESSFGLYSDHIAGQRLIRLFCRTEQPSPDQGEVLLLSTEADGYPDDQQFVRLESVDSRTTQVFTDDNGDYSRDVLICTISSALRFAFYGLETPPRRSSIKAPTLVRRTQVADAARYFSVQPLEAAAEMGDLQVLVDSPYVPLVPTSTAESSLVDQTPFADFAALVPSGAADALTVALSTSGSVAPDYAKTIYFGTPYARGTLRVTIGSVQLKDNGGGELVPLTPLGVTDGYAGFADYDDGSFTITRTTTWSAAVSATATAAGLFVAPPFTTETRIALGNRGYVYVFSCIPLPAPGTVTVSYRALGRWYTLRDNGAGQLTAAAGEGSGAINYGSGSVDVTLGALPDVDSSILLSWGTPRTADARYGDVGILAPIVRHTLEYGVTPGTLDITWLAGGVSKTASANAAGVISGHAVGELDNGSGELWFRPTLIPDSNSLFEFTYDKETIEVDSVPVTAASLTVTGTIDAGGDIKASSISIYIPFRITEGDEIIVEDVQGFRDDGAGGWLGKGGVGVTGTIDYETGEFSITFGSTSSERRPIYTYTQVYHWIVQTLTGYETVLKSHVPISGAASAKFRLASELGEAHEEELEGPPLVIDLTPSLRDPIVAGSARFTFAGRTYVDRSGSLYYGVSPTTNVGTLGGTLALSAGEATLTSYTGGGASNTVTINALLTVQGEAGINALFFRVPAQSIKRASLSIRANRVDTGALITGTSDINGVIAGTGITGEIDAEMGIVRVVFAELVTAAGNEAEDWYIEDAVDEDGFILKPILVDPSSCRYNVVTLKSIPIDAEVVGLDPVRLPVDGRVPWIRPGNVAVIHFTDTLEVASPSANDVTNLGATNVTYIKVRDSLGEPVLSTWYVLDLDAGTVTWADPLDLGAYELPIVIEWRVEDMLQVSDALITGEVMLARALSRDYPEGSYLSTALIPIPQDMAAAASNIFAQATWTNVWSDDLIGDAPAAAYNDIAYPFVVSNAAATTGRYRITFTSPTAFACNLEDVGQIGTGVISVDFAPNNPLTGVPYFTIDADGWGGGWASGNTLRFNIQGASYPIWFARCTLQGPIDEPSDSVRVELRGDAD